MNKIAKLIVMAGFIGTAFTGAAAAQTQLPSSQVGYVEYYADLHTGPGHGFPVVSTAPYGDLVIKLGCSSEDKNFCMVLYPLTGKSGYIHVEASGRPARTYDVAARGEGRATLTGDDRLRVAVGRDANWVGTVSGGTRVKIEKCQSNFCYVYVADGRQGWVHDGALERDRVLNPNLQVPAGELKRDLPAGGITIRR